MRYSGNLSGLSLKSYPLITASDTLKRPETILCENPPCFQCTVSSKAVISGLSHVSLQDLASSLLLNGYQTVEDLKDLKEQHLIELNVTDPEHRQRLLAATECLQDAERE